MEASFKLTLQVFEANTWQDAMILEFLEPQNGFASPCRYGYETAYLGSHLECIETLFAAAASVRVPPTWGRESLKHAPAFLYDIAPAGAAKRFLLNRVGAQRPDIFVASGLPEVTLNHPRIALRDLDQRLSEWGLR